MLLIRADGNARIGVGHLMRCLTIAEELAADVFLLAYKNLDSYDHSKSSITTWLCAIAANHVRNY